MSFDQIVTIVLYTVSPYLWLVLLALAALVAAFLIGRRQGGRRSGLVLPASIVLGVGGALLAPLLTGSRLQYVATTTDILAILSIGLAIALYCFLLLTPVWRTR